jgi:hypothetical protein
MSTEIKNQNTLYRFVSLRSPELSKKENQEFRFVFHPENDKKLANTSGIFFEAIKLKTDETKWEAMLSVVPAALLETVNEIEIYINDLLGDDGKFIRTAHWLANNRTNYKTSDLLYKINGLEIINPVAELNVWDNLFYQVLTQKEFYIKENLMQILVLNHLLKQTNSFDSEIDSLSKKALPNIEIIAVKNQEKIDKLLLLTNAKVVLPTVLFQEELTVVNNTRKKEVNTTFSPSKELNKTHEIIIAKNSIKILESAIVDIKKIEDRQRKENKVLFQKAYTKHQREIDVILKKYYKDYNIARRELCKLPRKENHNINDFCHQPNVEFPNLPEFTYSQTLEIDSNIIQNKLSKKNLSVLEGIIDWNNITSYEEIIESIKNKIQTAERKIVDKTNFKQKTLVLGDVSFVKFAESSNYFEYEICKELTSYVQTNFNMLVKLSHNLIDNNEISITTNFYNFDQLIGNQTTGVNAYSQGSDIYILSNFLSFDEDVDNNHLENFNRITGEITFSNGVVLTFDNPIDLNKSCTATHVLVQKSKETQTTNPKEEGNFIPKGFGLRRLGIADYKKVVSHVCCYDAGEVAHIENIMAREYKEKTTVKTLTKETTVFESQEIEKESVSDTTSTQRFEMQTEIAKMVQEQQQNNAHADVHTTSTGYTLDAGATYATNTSKEESNRQAVTQAKELTQRAMERVVSRIKNEKTVKTTESFTDTNSHIFDNRPSSENVSGVYRFINAIYKNQIYNYGKRMMFEFMIPQPGKLHYLGMADSNSSLNSVVLEMPIDPRTINYADFDTITESNYKALAAIYGADINQYPERYKTIGKSFSYSQAGDQETSSQSIDLEIPSGYQTIHSKIRVYAHWDCDTHQLHSFGITVGNIKLFKEEERRSFEIDFDTVNNSTISLDRFSEKIPISYQSINYIALNITITIKTEVSAQTVDNWKKETFDAIIKGYEAQLETYNQKLNEAKSNGIQMLNSNPLFYREIEQMVLRKNCISYLIDDKNTNSKRRFGRKMYNDDANFKNFQVTVSQDMDDYTSFVKFMEQAFDWNLMSYSFYPYYWGNREEWKDLYQYESNDPIFKAFMQAGMSRVVVTVKPGFEDAVMHYMTFGQIWNGGQMPILGDPLYISIVDELKEQEYTVEETWKTVLPTNLIGLQKSGVSVDATGLPCGDGCNDGINTQFKENTSKLGLPKIEA